MSDDNNSSDPFDFNFDAFNTDESQTSAGGSSFDLDNPFGDDLISSGSSGMSTGDLPESSGGSSFDLDNPFGDGLDSSSVRVSAGNPFLSGSAEGSEDESAESDDLSSNIADGNEESDKKKKGGGWFAKGKGKPVKEKKEKPKKEKVAKERKPKGESVPLDLGTVLCFAFSLFWLGSLLMLNVAAFFSRGPDSTIMQTVCFLGAFNIVGLVPAAVPILFYKFPKERTLPNIMLGISVAAMFGAILIAVTEFYHYGFVLGT